MKKNTLSLDLSSKSTGYAISIDNKIIDYGCIKATSLDPIKRIYLMRDEIKKIILKYKIQAIIAEEVPPKEDSERTRKVLMWLQAAVVFLVYDLDNSITIDYMQSSEWRKAIGIHTGRGVKRQELKQQDILYVKNKYKIDVNDDIADAICLMDAFQGQQGRF